MLSKKKKSKFAEEQAKKDREAAEEKKDKQDFIKVCIDSQKPFEEVKKYWDMLN